MTGPAAATTHQRTGRFDTGLVQGHAASGREMCMALRAGDHILLRAQPGFSPNGDLIGPGDPAAQAGEAMRNAAALLAGMGASLATIRKVTTYVTDRAWLAPVEAVVSAHLAGVPAVHTRVIVAGLAVPDLLVAIDIDAVAP